ncbi:hypothetical protein RUM43_010776 [Polyplax serrata]|uniref:Ubiquitin-like domain-containing protein n=1 Tax=Polyplax serrata TaxID=468196 RepID=A0AAN8Q592_POLSC
MSSNDSFNDFDELLNLYNFKSVTKVYKDQLQKLLTENVTPVVSNFNDENDPDITNNTLDELSNSKSFEFSKTVEIDISDDCLEVVAVDEQAAIRRSERLKRKRNIDNNDSIIIEDSENTIVQRRRKKGGGRKKKVGGKQQIIPEEVILDSSTDTTQNLCEEELNPEVSVKVIWKSISLKKFTLRKFQKLSKIYEELSKEENVPESRIILTFKNIKVNHSDTPSSLNFEVYDFLEGGLLSESVNSSDTQISDKINYNDEAVVLQFRDCNKKVVKVSINKNDSIKVGMIKYSEQLEIPLLRIKFFFDGELLDARKTPALLGLENDDIIDIEIFKQ